MSQADDNSEKTVWDVHARPIGASHEPWRVMRVSAKSPIQAEAILRRQGYEMALQTAMPSAEEAESIGKAHLQHLLCSSCGYPLKGLLIEHSYVRCPECSFTQPLLCWTPELVNQRDRPQMLHTVLIGIAALASVSTLLIILWLISMSL